MEEAVKSGTRKGALLIGQQRAFAKEVARLEDADLLHLGIGRLATGDHDFAYSAYIELENKTLLVRI